jgi:hypothetical protein
MLGNNAGVIVKILTEIFSPAYRNFPCHIPHVVNERFSPRGASCIGAISCPVDALKGYGQEKQPRKSSDPNQGSYPRTAW